MQYLLNESMESIASLRHFYDIQKKYIDKKAKQGMKDNRLGYLIDYYFSVLVNGNEQEKQQKTFQNLQRVIDNYIEIIEIHDKGIIYRIKDKNVTAFKNISNSAKEYERYAEMPRTHGNNTLIMLITRFEEFVANFIKLIYQKFPQKYLDKQTISFSEISNIGIDDIKDKIVAREIDHIMRDSYTVWFKLFEEHKMNFEKCAAELEILKELYARRNIIVHNSGIVNDSYLKNIPNTTLKCGEEIYADETYINIAFETIKTIIFCVLIEGSRLVKDDRAEYISNIFNGAYDELVAENYNTCKTVFYSLYNCPFANENTKYMAQVNYWIAKIETDGLSSVISEIQKLDVSALDRSFSIAKYVLLEKYMEATVLIEDLYKKKELPLYSLEEWPLFKHYRTSNEYAKFKHSHPELSGIVALEPKAENLMENEKMTQNVRAELQSTESNEK